MIHIDSTDHAFIALDAHSSSHNKGIYFQENCVHQSILEHEGGNNRLRIWDGSTTYVTIGDSTGDIHTIGDISADGNISGSATSTGSFGRLDIVDNVSATSFTGIFQGALSGSAQIASNISGAFAVASASFAADILTNSSSLSTRITKNEISASVNAASSASFSTRITTVEANSGSFSTRITRNEGTGSKILAGELEFTNITGSGHISMSLSSTGSFGRVSATTIGGHSPLVIDALTTFTNNITSSGEIQFNGKVFIQTGSIEGDLHVRTNENLMRIGKSTSGIIVSGSEEVSRFATGSDGSIIDLGFTVTDEDGNIVLAGDAVSYTHLRAHET